MIQILDTTSQAIRIKAVADIHWTAAWADSTATTLVEGSSSGISNSGTDSDIVTSPAASTRRIIKSITLYNSHASASRTVTLVFWDGSAERIIGKITLPSGSTWYSTDAGSSGGGSGVTDGNKGDIEVTNAGTPSENWAIKSGVVTLAKMANLAPDRVIGRITASTGVPEALTADNLISIVNAATTNTINFTRLAGVAAANHDQAWSTITSTPTTLSGYGITDALSNSNTSTQSGYFGDLFLQDDTSPSHYLQVTNSANLTAARTLALNVNDANRTISLSGDLTVSANATVSGTNTGDQTITLTGEVTGSGSGSFAATIANGAVVTDRLFNNAVTYAKMQDVSAPSRVIGRKTTGAGDPEELTASEVLNFVGSTQGSILYRGANDWLALTPGTSGQYLQTQGTGANPQWATVSGGGGGAYKNIVINGAMSLTSYKTAEGFIVPNAITSTSTSINVGFNTNHAGSLAPFPASGVVLVNSELIQYSAKTGETGAALLTVASGGRGFDGTTAASASIGATIALAPYRLGISTSGYYTADRWRTHINNSVGTWDQAVVNDAPSNTMFRRSLRMKCATAKASLDAADILRVEQLFEGQNVQHIRKGTSDAQQLTCSFFVKSSVTGTYIVELVDNNNSRRVSASYSITTANTWQEVSITFPADTTGVLTNDNAYSLGLCFWLVAGSTYTSGGSLQTTWGTATNTRAVGQINLSANAGQSWQITGVQLELGASKTAFEYLHITDVAALCARYYRFFPNAGVDDTCIGAGAGGTDRGVSLNLLITPAMRTGPTVQQDAIDIAARLNTQSSTFQIALGASGFLPFRTTGTYIILQALSNGMVRDTIDRVYLYRPLSLDSELAGGN